VRVCNLTGQCVVVKAGQMTTMRSGDNSAPPAPVQAPPSLVTGATTDTDSTGALSLAASAPAHISLVTMIVIGVIVAVPAVVIPVVGTRSANGTPLKPPSCSAEPGRPQPHCVQP